MSSFARAGMVEMHQKTAMARPFVDTGTSHAPASVRWAIVGTGVIAECFASDVGRTASASLSAVCSRTMARATSFARRHGGISVHTDLASLLGDPAVDAIYVASPIGLHAAQVSELLAGGKPVLCEKTLTTSSADTDALIRQSEAGGVFLMEALWTLYLPAIEQLREALARNEIGRVTAVRAELAYRKPYDPTNRFYSPALGGGALLDFGIYPISLALSLFGAPAEAGGHWEAAPSGVDHAADFVLSYPGFDARFSCSFLKNGANAFIIEGERGMLILEGPFHSAKRLFRASGLAANLISKSAVGRLGGLARRAARLFPGIEMQDCRFEGSGVQFEIEAASRAIRAGQIAEPTASHALSRAAIGIIDAIRATPPRR